MKRLFFLWSESKRISVGIFIPSQRCSFFTDASIDIRCSSRSAPVWSLLSKNNSIVLITLHRTITIEKISMERREKELMTLEVPRQRFFFFFDNERTNREIVIWKQRRRIAFLLNRHFNELRETNRKIFPVQFSSAHWSFVMAKLLYRLLFEFRSIQIETRKDSLWQWRKQRSSHVSSLVDCFFSDLTSSDSLESLWSTRETSQWIPSDQSEQRIEQDAQLHKETNSNDWDQFF